MNRKTFLKTSIYLGAGLPFIGCLSDKTQNGVAENNWNDGDFAHILPTANHNRMLVSTSLNDEASDQLITFPPKNFQLELGRIVQQMYYPEFLPDDRRPLDLPGTGATDRPPNVSESFGTLRYGNLAELLMYDCRRFVTLEGEKAQFFYQPPQKIGCIVEQPPKMLNIRFMCLLLLLDGLQENG